MAERALTLMTVDEFLSWDDGTDTRYELADGALRAMAPPDAAHRIVVANVTTLIHVGLRERMPCRPENEAGLRIDNRTMWQADIAVTCHPPAREIDAPLLIVEVLSPSTRTHETSAGSSPTTGPSPASKKSGWSTANAAGCSSGKGMASAGLFRTS